MIKQFLSAANGQSRDDGTGTIHHASNEIRMSGGLVFYIEKKEGRQGIGNVICIWTPLVFSGLCRLEVDLPSLIDVPHSDVSEIGVITVVVSKVLIILDTELSFLSRPSHKQAALPRYEAC